MPLPEPVLHYKKTLPLPVIADTHAFLCAGTEFLWLFINQYAAHRTQVLYITKNYELHSAGSILLLAANASATKNGIMVSGADAAGNPVVVSIDKEGKLVWEMQLEIPKPITWPMVIGTSPAYVVWQEENGKINTGYINETEKRLYPAKVLATGNTAVSFFDGTDKAWTAWKAEDGIHVTEMISGRQQVMPGTKTAGNELVVAQCNDGIITAWLNRKHIGYLLPGSDEPVMLPFDNSLGGTLSASCNGTLLLMVKQTAFSESPAPAWKMTIIIPGTGQYVLNEFVFDVLWWQQQVVLVCRDKIIFLAPG